jgi:hypothetical protein
MELSYKDGYRRARKSIIEALDYLAAIEGPMPETRIYLAKDATKTQLVNAKAQLDKALGE